MLVHHANSGGYRIPGTTEVDRFVIEQDLPFVRFVQTVENVHQGAFAGTVFAQQGVDLTRLDHDIDRVVGHQGPKPLGDPA